MKTIETERLILRKFEEADFGAVHAYASNAENITYMLWDPNNEQETSAFINTAIENANKNPCTNFQYAAVLKKANCLIGGCNLDLAGDEAEIGWILHSDYWRQSFAAEMGKALPKFGFEELNLHRILAHCDAENHGSYRVMEKIGMRREGIFFDSRPAHKFSSKKYGDELSYAILKDEWEIQNEIAYYNSQPFSFCGFIDLPELSDGEIYLVCIAKKQEIPEKKYVPAYDFAICKGGEKIGEINLRIGYTEGLYYGGQIGYGIDDNHRGNGYASRACRLLSAVAKAHGMKKLLITNNYNNTASKRVCEKLGARLVRFSRVPDWHDLYKEGQRFINIYEWTPE